MSGNLSAIPLFLFTLFIISFLNPINGSTEGNILYDNGDRTGNILPGPPFPDPDNPIYGSGPRNTLYTYQPLPPGYYLEYKSSKLIMQHDCNLVLYENNDLLWASNTRRPHNLHCFCRMESDGNLVIYEVRHNVPGRTMVWTTNTGGPKGYYVLVLQADRNLGICGSPALWTTNTSMPDNGRCNTLSNNNYLNSGGDNNSLPCDFYYLIMQKDCNLVIYRRFYYSRTIIPIWASNSQGAYNSTDPLTPNCTCIMQSTGNLVINREGKQIWATNTSGPEGYYFLMLQLEGKASIYGSPKLWGPNTTNTVLGGGGAGSASNVAGMGH